MTNHWLACGWFIIHRYMERNIRHTWATTDCPGSSGGGGGGDGIGIGIGAGYGNGCLAARDDELGRHNVCNSESMTTCYICSFYLVITTISTVGYGDISPVTPLETIYENAVVLTGACFFAGIIGAFSAWLSQRDTRTAGSNAFKLKLQRLVQYMACRNFPSDLQDEIIAYHKHRWDHRRAAFDDTKSLLGILPLPLQMDLSYEVVRNVIEGIPFLATYPVVVRKRIAHALRVQICPPRSTIYAVGDIGWDVYLIGKGVVSITLPDNTSVLDAAGRANAARTRRKQDAIGNLYRPGNHFGESCITSESGVRQETAVSESSVELYMISKAELEAIWRYMPLDQRDCFTNDMLSRNGNTWHSFGGHVDDHGDDGEAGGGVGGERSPSLPLAAAGGRPSPSSPTSQLLRRQASARRLTRRGSAARCSRSNKNDVGSGCNGATDPPRTHRRRRVVEEGRGGKGSRLKSFSAASSIEALESSRSPSNSRTYPGKEKGEEEEEEEGGEAEIHVFGIEISRLFSVQAGASLQSRRGSIAEAVDEGASSATSSDA